MLKLGSTYQTKVSSRGVIVLRETVKQTQPEDRTNEKNCELSSETFSNYVLDVPWRRNFKCCYSTQTLKIRSIFMAFNKNSGEHRVIYFAWSL